MISSLGGLGGFASPTILGWVKSQTGSLYFGFSVLGCILLCGALVLLIGIPARLLRAEVRA